MGGAGWARSLWTRPAQTRSRPSSASHCNAVRAVTGRPREHHPRSDVQKLTMTV